MLKELLDKGSLNLDHQISEAMIIASIRHEAKKLGTDIRQCIIIENRKAGSYLEGSPLNDDIKVIFIGFRVIGDNRPRTFVILQSEDMSSAAVEEYRSLGFEDADILDIEDRKQVIDVSE